MRKVVSVNSPLFHSTISFQHITQKADGAVSESRSGEPTYLTLQPLWPAVVVKCSGRIGG
jgi:hypothetical protein